jgi:HlyD family secretion protein
VAQADLELARANERQASVTAQEVEHIRAQLDQAKAQLVQSTARLGYTDVRAPLSGVVSLRVARQGEVIRQGEPIVTIIDLDDVWVKAEESHMNRVRIGQALPASASGEQRRAA